MDALNSFLSFRPVAPGQHFLLCFLFPFHLSVTMLWRLYGKGTLRRTCV